MHAILVSLGTDGDILPYLALGAELRKRGHHVTAVLSEEYRRRAVELGFEFLPFVSTAENHELLHNPDFWHPLKGGMIGAAWGVARIANSYAMLRGLVRDPEAMLIVSPAVLAARVIQDQFGTRGATLILQPWMLPSMHEPPIMALGLTLPRWSPWALRWLYFRMFDCIGHVLIGRQINRFRATLGLPPVGRVFQWWHSPGLVIGMFPEWFGKAQPDWPQQVRLAGFPLADAQASAELPEALRAFCKSGEPPIVVTAGTGMIHAEGLFRAAADACRLLGMRAIFLTRYAAQLPDPLPPGVVHVEFAPFERLFPLCAAVIHHGGVGTAAAALAAGVGHLVLPQAWDQFENASRLERLGVARSLKVRHRRGKPIARAIEELLQPAVKARCAELAEKLQPHDGISRAADLVEETFHSGKHPC